MQRQELADITQIQADPKNQRNYLKNETSKLGHLNLYINPPIIRSLKLEGMTS